MNSKIKEKIQELKKDKGICKKLIRNYCSIKKAQEVNEYNELFKKININKKEEIYY